MNGDSSSRREEQAVFGLVASLVRNCSAKEQHGIANAWMRGHGTEQRARALLWVPDQTHTVAEALKQYKVQLHHTLLQLLPQHLHASVGVALQEWYHARREFQARPKAFEAVLQLKGLKANAEGCEFNACPPTSESTGLTNNTAEKPEVNDVVRHPPDDVKSKPSLSWDNPFGTDEPSAIQRQGQPQHVVRTVQAVSAQRAYPGTGVPGGHWYYWEAATMQWCPVWANLNDLLTRWYNEDTPNPEFDARVNGKRVTLAFKQLYEKESGRKCYVRQKWKDEPSKETLLVFATPETDGTINGYKVKNQ